MEEVATNLIVIATFIVIGFMILDIEVTLGIETMVEEEVLMNVNETDTILLDIVMNLVVLRLLLVAAVVVVEDVASLHLIRTEMIEDHLLVPLLDLELELVLELDLDQRGLRLSNLPAV